MKRNGSPTDCRRRGVLMHVSSLPSEYGIGTFGRQAYRFIDMLRESGACVWSVLPLGPTGFGDSPYQSFSSFALNPYFLDLEQLCEKGFLTREECESVDWGPDPSSCDYAALYGGRMPLLMTAYARAMLQPEVLSKLHSFAEENPHIRDYALFTAIKAYEGGKPWYEWEPELRARKPKALRAMARKVDCECRYHLFVQQQLYEQWDALHAYAAENGVELMGDMPIYCAYDSADCWAHADMFQLDAELRQTSVAGVPPDYFCELGQRWGNPLYDWQKLRRTGYKFWLERMAAAARLYDILRIDHFRGFEAYYAIPASSPDARQGEWRKGCGYELFKRFKAMQDRGEAPMCEIVAEDLGFITPNVKRLLTRTGFAGMQVLQFAFDGSRKNPHLNKKWDGDPQHIVNKVCYTGTHDNPPIAAWWPTVSEAERRRVMKYCGIKGRRLSDAICRLYPCDEQELADCGETKEECEFAQSYMRLQCSRAAFALCCAAAECNAELILLPMQDVLCLGAEARMNTPSVQEGNWRWRITEEQMPAAEKNMGRIFRSERE